MGIFKGQIARRLILTFAALAVLAIAMTAGSVLLVQFTDRTLLRVAALTDAAAVGARIRSESLTLTDMVRHYTLLGPSERPPARQAMFEQQQLLSELINQAYRSAIPGDEAEFEQVNQVKLKLHGFLAQSRRVVNAFDSERALGPATTHELRVLVQDYQDPLVGAIRDFEQLEIGRANQARAEAQRVVQIIVSALALLTLVVVAASLSAIQQVVTRIIQPLARVRAGVEEFRQGKLDRPVQTTGQDEVSGLANAFNVMAAELQQSRARLEEHARTLEQRVDERTAQLQQANAALARRAAQLEISSAVGQQAASILNLDALLTQVVNLIQTHFGYYAVSVWLVTDGRDEVALRAGVGAQGEALRQDQRIPMRAHSIIVNVCETGNYRLVDDVRTAADYLPDETLPDTRSELSLPLRTGGQIVGALDIQSDQPAAFSFEETQRVVMQTLADQIAIAIRNAQLYQLEQTRRKLAEALGEAGRELSSSLDLRQVPERILEQLNIVVPYERGAVILQQNDVLKIVAQRGFPGEQSMQWDIPIREGDVFQQIAARRRPLLVNDVTLEPGWQQVQGLPVHRSWLGVPLISKDRVMGMVSLTRPQAGSFTPDEAALVAAFAAQAAIALENASLYDEIKCFSEQLEHKVQQRTRELETAYQTLQHLDRNKSDFIEVAAHELRTPLTVIRGYTQLLDQAGGAAQTRDLVKGIRAGVDRLHEIVNSMLDVTKIDSQTLRMRKERTHVQPIVESIRAELGAALQERRLAFTLTGLQELPPIHADPNLLFKVFYHLIVNAIKFTPDGGTIAVEGQTIYPADPQGEKLIEVVVCDNGIGIDPAHHELIFEKFYQTGQVSVHSSGKTKFKGGGPGLGLAIARGIVLAHGGKIWVESAGHDEMRCPGSRFHVQLPVNW